MVFWTYLQIIIWINIFILAMALNFVLFHLLFVPNIARGKDAVLHSDILIIKIYTLVLRKGPTQELDDTTITVETECSINF